MTNPIWTPEKTALMNDLYEQGLSYGQIAAVLTNTYGDRVTRGSIAGRLNRLRQVGKPRPVKSRPEPIVESISSFTLELKDVGRGQCIWPSGDIREGTLRFCGCAVSPQEPYCQTHLTISQRRVYDKTPT